MEPQPLPSSPAPQPAAEAPVDVSAGFWLRGGAYMIDGMVVTAAGALTFLLPGVIGGLARLAVSAAYFTLMPAMNGGQTLGKMAAGIAIVRDDGSELGAGRCLVRWLGYMISTILLAFGFIMAAFTDRKRALHDFLAGTRVVRVAEISTARQAVVILAGLLLPLVAIAGIAAAVAIPGMLRMKNLAGEGATKGRLGSLRAGISIYYGDTNGQYPATLDALVPKYVQKIQLPAVQEHPGAAGVEIYGAEVCGGPKGLDIAPEKARDTGKWGYVADPKAPCYGTIFVDCTHRDSKGSAWLSY